MAEYEETTQEIFINTEQNFGSSGGDQVNRFRLNFLQEPFESGDEAILRINMTQFNLQKNFYDVNATNNTLRISTLEVSGGPPGSLVMTAGDEFISLPTGDYLNSPDLLMASLGQTIVNYINSKITAPAGTTCSFQMGAGAGAAGGTTENVDTATAFAINASQNFSGGGVVPNEVVGGNYDTVLSKVQKNKQALFFELSSTTAGFTGDFRDVGIKIQCLNIPPGQGTVVTDKGNATPNEQFNDSYALLGGVRIETIQATPLASLAADALTSFSFQRDNTAGGNNLRAVMVGAYPIATGCNTLPYVYLRCEEAENQSSRSIEDAAQSHDHEIIPSRILAKIPRVMDNRQSISYRLENVGGLPFFTNITANYVNHLIFSVTDHRGRVIQPVAPDDYPASVQQRLVDNPGTINTMVSPGWLAGAGTQNTVGNLYCDFAFKISKHNRKIQKNVLQTVPPPILTNNRMEFSGVIPNSIYQN